MKAATLWLIAVFFIAAFAPWVTPYSYEEQNIEARLQNPSAQHWMGTDTLGRDQFARIAYGSRLSLSVGVLTAIVALVIGVTLGALSGYRGGVLDSIIMRLVDMMLIFPSILTAILLMLIFGRGFFGIFLAIAVTSWPTLARLVRGLVLQAKTLPYVEAARAIGASEANIIYKHILLNLINPILVSLTIQIPNNIMAESFLSFIGLGLEPPYSSWGTLANEGFRGIQSYPHLIIFPGGVLFLTILSFNYLANQLQKTKKTILIHTHV